MKAATGKRKNAARINTIGRFETEILTLKENIDSLSNINGSWIEKAMEKKTHQKSNKKNQDAFLKAFAEARKLFQQRQWRIYRTEDGGHYLRPIPFGEET